MKKIFLMALAVLVLTGCDEEKRQQSFINGLKERKNKAEEITRAGNYSTEKLLVIQEYFFDFAEKVHMMKEDAQLTEGVKALISKDIKAFCDNYLLKKSDWLRLDAYCQSGDNYICSFEMRDYNKIGEKFGALVGPDINNKIKAGCDF